MTDLTRTLAAHLARTRAEDVPPAALRVASHSLLDALGVSLAASGLEPACAPFAALAGEQGGECTVLGFKRRASPLMAAFANGALAHALDFEDTFDAAPVHPNAAGVAVALALAERTPGLSGLQLLAAVALGGDLVCRLALALQRNPDDDGFYTPAILSAFGAAAVASKLLALTEDQIVSALALTLSQAASSGQFKRDPRSDVRAVRDAFAAHAGLTASLLAAGGVRGFEGAIDGPHGLYGLYARGAYDPGALCAELGHTFHAAAVSFKPWPSCRGTHAFIEAALALRTYCPPQAIERVVAYGAPLNRMLIEPEAHKRRPRTATDAKFSLPFCVSLAFARGAPSLDDFGAARLEDSTLLALAERVFYSSDTGYAATSGRLEVQLRGGRRECFEVQRALGHPDNPLGTAHLIDKFVACAGRAALPLTAAEAAAVADATLSIERATSARASLAGLLVGEN